MAKKIIKTFELIEPITVGERTVHILEFTQPKAGALRSLDQPGELSAMLDFISRCTGEHVSIIDQLSSEDFTKVNEYASDLLGKFIGQTS